MLLFWPASLHFGTRTMLFMVWLLCLIGSSFVMFLVSLVLDVLRNRMGAGFSGGLELAARL